MKRPNLFNVIISAVMVFSAENLLPAEISSVENNSIAAAGRLSSGIIKNPSGSNVPACLEELIDLAPAAGREKISGILKEAVKKLEKEQKTEDPSIQVIRMSIDMIDGDYSESKEHFSVIRKWNLSGRWRMYGKPDIDFRFPPEKVYKIEDIEKGKNISAGESGVLYPYQYNHQEDETLYAVSSFESSGRTVLWIQSDAVYRLIINGREIYRNESGGKNSTGAFALNGASGYSVQVKMQSGGKSCHPYLRAMITDEKNRPVKISYSTIIFSNNFTAEKLLSSDETGKPVTGEASVSTARIRDIVRSGNYKDAYRLGLPILEKFPFYSGIYNEFIPLLDLMNREDEFFKCIKIFRKNFPDSMIYNRWLADFYMTRDKEKFEEIMKTAPVRDLSPLSVESYFYLLCGEKKYSAAVELGSKMNADSRFSCLIPEVIRESGDNELWRKKLLEGAAERGDAAFYYALGLAEMQIGLDPVMYWNKGYSLDGDHRLMRDLSDIYENSILKSNDFYSGQYTDLHPEFGWYGKKRKISVHISESGRVFLTGEDTIPSGRKIRNEKFSEGASEFSSGEIRTSVPYFKGIKILYALTAKDGLPSAAVYNSMLIDNNRFKVSYKCSGEEEFSVVKYSGELDNGEDVFSLVKGLILKNRDEKISELDYEIISDGSFTPLVSYKGKPLPAGKYSDRMIKFEVNEKFSEDQDESVLSEISRFPSDQFFAGWYRNVIIFSSENFNLAGPEISENNDLGSKIRGVHFNIMSSVLKEGFINFNPRRMESVLLSGKGTVEEKTLVAKAVLGKKGIMSYISFKKNRDGLIDRILLYVPENRNRGYWLDFYGEVILNNTEPGSEALVITGEGCQTFTVNPETYIR